MRMRIMRYEPTGPRDPCADKKEGAVALKRVTASFLCLKHKNRTSKSAVFAVKYIYATK